ncbi:unnamed protein product [Spirodela intermedia]|uniref:Uncharacterized protein n=1 Tax=Spirodela intermedia TaxID=51605 RepID=A0A7I8I8W6_SPIIN|nr:unnamed protein product [Spirodela intermedia]CAA6654117.1 unnamed protein product [Spirodela intermedia]
MDAVAWGSQLASALHAAGVSLPSPGLAHALVSYVCWSGHHVPASWKYVDWALASGLAPPVLVLAHLSIRVLPYRRSRPSAYRLYMELLKGHVFTFAPEVNKAGWKQILSSVDALLHLSETFGTQDCEPGVLLVEFVFCILWQLVDASLDDEGLLELTPEKKSWWLNKPQGMDIDGEETFDEKSEFSEKLWKANTVMSIELVGMLLQHKLISGLLCLARQNMPLHWGIFARRLQLVATNSLALRNSAVSPDKLLQLSLHSHRELGRASEPSQYQEFCAITSGPHSSLGGLCHGASHSSLWIPLDIYLEDCVDGSVAATNAIEIISGLVKALQAINRTTWHDAFLGLWVAALRLVQRERDPIEGPIPHIDTRLCLLLSITTLSVADIIREEETNTSEESGNGANNPWKEKLTAGERRKALMSSIQVLGDYETLLAPPKCSISVANQAAAKAMLFISEFNVSSGYFESISTNEKTLDCSGNMRHLIVEACIARNLLDTSAYFWPGYVNGRISQLPHAMPGQGPGWSALMMGAPLTSSMINVLENTPASSLGELEKIFEIASNGSDDDRISAATILFTLTPIPVDYSGIDSHLISHAPVLFVILTGISSVDCVQVFSFHGLVPELAGALMAICEVFGSCLPSISRTLSSGEVSTHAVFSNAFILLLRLWKFNHPPLEYCIMGDGAPVGSQLTPEYLLLLRNSYVVASSQEQNSRKQVLPNTTDMNPIFVDSFPKLKIWYRQHQACLASTLSGLVPGTPVHHNVDSLLSMMFRKLSRGNQSVGSGASGSSSLSNSSNPGIEDASLRPKLAAWDILEAVPFVVDAALTACSHSKLSPRELATGLKDLADFLPASLATIVSYFSAEVTRGVWEPAFMNGTDWPSPAANLSTVEDHIKKIVAATGVDVPSLVTAGSSRARLPLPLAAFVSLTITYKLDSASERFLNLAGPALENLAASCPWPSMPIVAALWTQKVKRWSDFLIFSASRTVFHHNNNAVVQLLRSCFNATLGLSAAHSSGGVGSLLGHGFGSHFCGGLSPVAPGILYLRIYRCIKDILLLTGEILSLLMSSVKLIADAGLPREKLDKLKKGKHRMQYGQPSLVSIMTQIKVAASLGATFAWLSEMLPSWFLSVREADRGGEGGTAAMFEGYALAYFAVLCGMFGWGIGSTSVSKRRPRVLRAHLEFLANAIDGKISLGCGWATWRAYVLGFLGLVVQCAPCWVLEASVDVLKRLSSGLRHWNEDELAFALLERGGVLAMGAAADLLLASQ